MYRASGGVGGQQSLNDSDNKRPLLRRQRPLARVQAENSGLNDRCRTWRPALLDPSETLSSSGRTFRVQRPLPVADGRRGHAHRHQAVLWRTHRHWLQRRLYEVQRPPGLRRGKSRSADDRLLPSRTGRTGPSATSRGSKSTTARRRRHSGADYHILYSRMIVELFAGCGP